VTQTTEPPSLLAYATGTPPELSSRGWRKLFWTGAIHLLAMVTLTVFGSFGIAALVRFFRDIPIYNWFVIGMLIHNGSLLVMILANGIAVAGYAAGVNQKSPRRWFLIYVPTQLGLMLVQYGLTIALALGSPYQLTPSSSIGMSMFGVFVMPGAYALINLPLFLLLFPRIRRACFAG
jgi:hypothetical protein